MVEQKVYAEDLEPGATYDLGTHDVSAEEIIDFATQWDPQGFHVDEEIARNGPFGGLIGSGLHSMAILQRLAVTGTMHQWSVIAGRWMSDVEMTSPLRPGTTVRGVLAIEDVQHRGPERSLVVIHPRLILPDDTIVVTFRAAAYLRRRPGGPGTT